MLLSKTSLFDTEMRQRMACSTQSNQVRVVIITSLAAQLLVMDLKVLSGTAGLAFPIIAAQHLFSELVV